MKRWMLAISLLCGACSGKAAIEGQLSRDVKPDAFDWDDPGATPDPPLDGGGPEGDSAVDTDSGVDMDSAVDGEPESDDAG